MNGARGCCKCFRIDASESESSSPHMEIVRDEDERTGMTWGYEHQWNRKGKGGRNSDGGVLRGSFDFRCNIVNKCWPK